MKNRMRLPGRIIGQTLHSLFRRPATIDYPAAGENPAVEKHYRGRLCYDAGDCINCGLCQRDCPTGALHIVNEGSKEAPVLHAELNLARCIFCCQCVDSCRRGCLSCSQDVNLASPDKSGLLVRLDGKG